MLLTAGLEVPGNVTKVEAREFEVVFQITNIN